MTNVSYLILFAFLKCAISTSKIEQVSGGGDVYESNSTVETWPNGVVYYEIDYLTFRG
jgi:hypothetical protein